MSKLSPTGFTTRSGFMPTSSQTTDIGGAAKRLESWLVRGSREGALLPRAECMHALNAWRQFWLRPSEAWFNLLAYVLLFGMVLLALRSKLMDWPSVWQSWLSGLTVGAVAASMVAAEQWRRLQKRSIAWQSAVYGWLLTDQQWRESARALWQRRVCALAGVGLLLPIVGPWSMAIGWLCALAAWWWLPQATRPYASSGDQPSRIPATGHDEGSSDDLPQRSVKPMTPSVPNRRLAVLPPLARALFAGTSTGMVVTACAAQTLLLVASATAAGGAFPLAVCLACAMPGLLILPPLHDRRRLLASQPLGHARRLSAQLSWLLILHMYAVVLALACAYAFQIQPLGLWPWLLFGTLFGLLRICIHAAQPASLAPDQAVRRAQQQWLLQCAAMLIIYQGLDAFWLLIYAIGAVFWFVRRSLGSSRHVG